jgi:hypothetical protein
MNAANDITAIRARLPYLDRRALSQAWYSALHMASDGSSAGVKHAFAICQLASDGRLPAAADSSRESRARLPLSGSTLLRRPEGAVAGNPANVSRRAERAAVSLATTRRYPPLRATFTLTIQGARVQIVVRREGATLHVVALCTRRHLELVRRALACADFALRAEGERVRCSLRPAEGAE